MNKDSEEKPIISFAVIKLLSKKDRENLDSILEELGKLALNNGASRFAVGDIFNVKDELRVAVIFEYPSEISFQLAQKVLNDKGQGIGKDAFGKKAFDGIGTHYRARIYYQKPEKNDY